MTPPASHEMPIAGRPGVRRTVSRKLNLEAAASFFLCAFFVVYVGRAVYQQDLAILVIIYAFLALGMYAPLALGGRLSLAYNAYFAIGAYSIAILARHGTAALWLAPVIAVILSMLTATVLGIATRRLSGFHLAVATLMFGIAVHTWLVHSGELTGGPEGMGNIPRLTIAGWALGRLQLIALGAALVWLIATGISRFRVSFVGIAVRTQRESPPAALACGVPVTVLQIFGLALGAGIASLGGIFLALMNQFVLPESFAVKVVFLVLFMPILGGMSTPWGSVLGALIVVFFTLGFNFFEGPGVLTFGVLSLVVLLLAPTGVLGALGALRDKVLFRLRSPRE